MQPEPRGSVVERVQAFGRGYDLRPRAGEFAARPGAGSRGAPEVLLTDKTCPGRETPAALPGLCSTGLLATGDNVVETAAARERGIVDTNVPAHGTASVPQFPVALLVELCAQAGVHAAAVRAGGWTANRDWSVGKTPQMVWAGRRCGWVGQGRIGGQTARIAEALGMRVLGTAVRRGGDFGALLEQSDVVSLPGPQFPERPGLLGAS